MADLRGVGVAGKLSLGVFGDLFSTADPRRFFGPGVPFTGVSVSPFSSTVFFFLPRFTITYKI
jgi:hypothetical protein